MSFVLFSLLFVFQMADGVTPLEVDAGSAVTIENDFDSSYLEIDQLILNENSSLKLSDFKSIRIRELVAKEGAKIQILQAGSGADGAFSADGQDGADALFFIDSLNGHLVVESQGGNGGDGRDGQDGQQGVSGQKGRNAFRFLFFYFGKGGTGQAGGPGEDGSDGEDGGNGGNGGDLKVFYKQKSEDSSVFVDVSAGQAGMGGRAGRGGLGGFGGPGGKGNILGDQGPMGAPGKSGRPGRPGSPGSSGEVAIYQVDVNLYSCFIQDQLLHMTQEEWAQCLGS